jgi:hypothetical protein
MDFPDDERFGNTCPVLAVDPQGTLWGLMPFDPVVSGPESFEHVASGASPAMVPHHDVDAMLAEEVDMSVAGEGGIGENHVSGPEKVPELTKEGAFIYREGAFGQAQKRSGGEGEHGQNPHDGESATGLLGGGLWVAFLVLWGIGHGNRRAIDHLDPSSIPLGCRLTTRLTGVGDLLVECLKVCPTKTLTGFAVGGRLGRSASSLAQGEPCEEFADHLSAGTVCRKDLRKEKPERARRAEEALSCPGIELFGESDPGVGEIA